MADANLIEIHGLFEDVVGADLARQVRVLAGVTEEGDAIALGGMLNAIWNLAAGAGVKATMGFLDENLGPEWAAEFERFQQHTKLVDLDDDPQEA